ncbi:MAG: lysophospholipid acyltransferase family protein [Desulfarculaceae bacterium]|nr:lysophospholipid acyltransferase family protein [Desulfarculaceae bacterium]MCF8072254.1 lysophospholipid acyltransferase family protein [Desulfarculaceae bacterium]MCF8100175.1 lysophospholipid acyltransferase family protein [Desulfarculaceae bacterium]MCF8117881.1 lysophospholipid acyltransferase family protein [Desulfarculaceae bacterium]
MSAADAILKGAVYSLSLAPLGLTRAVGRGLGRMARGLDSRHREIVQRNLAASFPEKDPAWIERIGREVFEHAAQVAVEIPRLVRLSPAQIAAHCRFHGLDNVHNALERGKGLILLTGHFGNWEWANIAGVQALGISGLIVARPIDWPPADRLVNGWRTKGSGSEVVPKSRSARILLRGLKDNRMLGLLLDQNVDWYDGEWVDFFGRPACTNKGMALLARTTEAPVLPFYNWRAQDGKFEVHFGSEIPLVKTSDKTRDTWDNTQNYTRVLEEIIRQNPSQWFWLHQRWKTRPFHTWPREPKE